jgi:hypothetical protein
MINKFDSYLRTLRETPLDQHTEHTGRASLQSLLNGFAAGRAAIQHEPKRQNGSAPDFKITRDGAILGYVEVKAVGADLDKVLKSDQIKRYKDLSGNLVVTNYLDFIWIERNFVHRATLLTPHELASGAFRLGEHAATEASRLLQGFFSAPPQKIGRAQDLAVALATRSKLLKEFLTEELIRQTKRGKGARLHGLYQVFRDQVFHDLKLEEFADAFAQMLAYGLFLARLNSGANAFNLGNARDFVPGSFRLIRELVDFLHDLKGEDYRDVRWVVEEVLSIVNSLDLCVHP